MRKKIFKQIQKMTDGRTQVNYRGASLIKRLNAVLT